MSGAVRTRTGEFDPAAVTLSAHDHACVIGRGPAGYAATVAEVLDRCDPADLLLAMGDLDDSAPAHRVDDAAAAGRVVLVDPVEAYRELDTGEWADAMVLACDAFDRLVQQALVDGYRTVRVVADNTTRLADVSAEQRRRWWEWEHVVDVWETTRPITGTCWFDADRLGADDVAGVLRRHAVSHGADTPWRVFHRPDGHTDGGTPVALAGEVDAFDAADLAELLAGLDAVVDAPAVRRFDLTDVTYLHHRALTVSAGGTGGTAPVRLLNPPPGVRRMVTAAGAWPQLVLD